MNSYANNLVIIVPHWMIWAALLVYGAQSIVTGVLSWMKAREEHKCQEAVLKIRETSSDKWTRGRGG